jgi:hypothetical protein
MSDVDEDDDVGVSQSVSRKNRGTKGVTELYYFVLALDYFEQSDDIETQFSEDNNDYIGGQYNTDYNNIDDASENNHSYVEEFLKYTTDGVATRKDKESKSTYIHPVAFNLKTASLLWPNSSQLKIP